jgi:hypothetical protein
MGEAVWVLLFLWSLCVFGHISDVVEEVFVLGITGVWGWYSRLFSG